MNTKEIALVSVFSAVWVAAQIYLVSLKQNDLNRAKARVETLMYNFIKG